MNACVRSIVFLFLLIPLEIYAGTKITGRQEIVFSEIPKPAHIWVHDFAATSADIPPESALSGQSEGNDTQQTAEQISTGRKLGAEIAADLVKEIRKMGLPAARPTAEERPQINDLVIQGSLISIVSGSAKKRFIVGL